MYTRIHFLLNTGKKLPHAYGLPSSAMRSPLATIPLGQTILHSLDTPPRGSFNHSAGRLRKLKTSIYTPPRVRPTWRTRVRLSRIPRSRRDTISRWSRARSSNGYSGTMSLWRRSLVSSRDSCRQTLPRAVDWIGRGVFSALYHLQATRRGMEVRRVGRDRVSCSWRFRCKNTLLFFFFLVPFLFIIYGGRQSNGHRAGRKNVVSA